MRCHCALYAVVLPSLCVFKVLPQLKKRNLELLGLDLKSRLRGLHGLVFVEHCFFKLVSKLGDGIFERADLGIRRGNGLLYVFFFSGFGGLHVFPQHADRMLEGKDFGLSHGSFLLNGLFSFHGSLIQFVP